MTRPLKTAHSSADPELRLLYRQTNALCYHTSIRPRVPLRWVAEVAPTLAPKASFLNGVKKPPALNQELSLLRVFGLGKPNEKSRRADSNR